MNRLGKAALLAFLLATPTAAWSQFDEVWAHQQRVQAQQAEEARLRDLAMDYGGPDDYEDEEYDDDDRGYAPNRFVSFPPEAWADWVRHGQEQSRQLEEERMASNPAYRALVQGTWTYLKSDPGDALKACQATFWTRNGGVSFIHFGGKEDFTLLGFFGAMIPSVKDPRLVELDLIQSGETQKVRAINLHFGPVESMGMVLFSVQSPKILLGAIEDRQDFEIRLAGETIAQGAWHSGLKARDELSACLKSQGYL